MAHTLDELPHCLQGYFTSLQSGRLSLLHRCLAPNVIHLHRSPRGETRTKGIYGIRRLHKSVRDLATPLALTIADVHIGSNRAVRLSYVLDGTSRQQMRGLRYGLDVHIAGLVHFTIENDKIVRVDELDQSTPKRSTSNE